MDGQITDTRFYRSGSKTSVRSSSYTVPLTFLHCRVQLTQQPPCWLRLQKFLAIVASSFLFPLFRLFDDVSKLILEWELTLQLSELLRHRAHLTILARCFIYLDQTYNSGHEQNVWHEAKKWLDQKVFLRNEQLLDDKSMENSFSFGTCGDDFPSTHQSFLRFFTALMVFWVSFTMSVCTEDWIIYFLRIALSAMSDFNHLHTHIKGLAWFDGSLQLYLLI